MTELMTLGGLKKEKVSKETKKSIRSRRRKSILKILVELLNRGKGTKIMSNRDIIFCTNTQRIKRPQIIINFVQT